MGFRDRGRAVGNLERLSGQLPERLAERLSVLLRNAADPDGAVHYLRRLMDEQPFSFQRIVRSATAVQSVLTVFSHSHFLAEQLLKTPEWIEPLPQSGDMYRQISADEFGYRLDARLARHPRGDIPAEEFAVFRREQILRVLLRDLQGEASLPEVTEELSNLADAILDCAWRRIVAALMARHGQPMLEDQRTAAGLSIVALGKLGGRELNYSSDIDLMFVYSGNGETAGPDRISNKEFYKKACVTLTDLLSRHTTHGFCYRVDLRLRPEGAHGELCLSLDGMRTYYQKRARDWELQMLIKARVAAGDRWPGRDLLEFVEPLIYSSSLDFPRVEAVSEARTRIHEKAGRTPPGLDVKLAPGGIRDVEFLVQCLQRLHGGREPWVRQGGTLLALGRLRDKDQLSEIEYGRLAPAYTLFRDLEHRLQVLDDRQTHTLPDDPAEREMLARRMPPAILGAERSAAQLESELQRHLANVREIYERVVRAQLPGSAPLELAPSAAPRAPHLGWETFSPNLARVLAQKAPLLAATLARGRLRYGARAFEHFLEHALQNPEWIGWLDQDPKLAGFAVDIFEHSPFFAEQFNRKPELIVELHEIRRRPERRPNYAEMIALVSDPADLRRSFNREMLRIQCESICLKTPIFETLRRTSDLGDAAIGAVYAMALEQVAAAQGRPSPENRMMVAALGRLGMQEFDLGSDADLIFILPDEDSADRVFWTRVAERIIELLTAHTGDGTLFAADTRLRPNGRAGPLVQTESAYKEYFARSAQAWEGITYMKARAITGNTERATGFLSELQDVDWRRYGQGGRSKALLRQMRLRIEQEQGRDHPLKAGPGGYYDIDFALMYLRLKSAGIFFKVLNTPARIDIIEKMGHLDRPDASFLLDAATFYRAVDHALRLSSGHAEGKLPAAQLQLQMIGELVGRWTPAHLQDQPLPVELAQIQLRTREFFDRLFS